MSTASPTSPSPAQAAPDLLDTHDVPRTLDEGQRVEFEVGQGTKGPQATGVRAV